MPFPPESVDSCEPPAELGQKLHEQIQARITRQEFETWFRDTPCRFEPPARFVFTTRNRFRSVWVKNKFGELLEELAAELCGTAPELRFEILNQTGTPPSSVVSEATDRRPPPKSTGALPDISPFPRLNRDFTFENFVVGPESELAHAAAEAVSKHPGKTCNPLYVYGGSGVGKTHLLQSLCHSIASTSRLRLIYVKAEEFTNTFLHACEQRTLDSFRDQYRTADVLILDDVHFLASKKATQKEFLHTFNTLLSENRQVVLSGNVSPDKLEGFPERQLSRFRWAVKTEIFPPTFDTKVAILRQKAELRGQELPLETAEHLARRVTGNVRELEGALTHLIGRGRMYGIPLTPEAVEATLRDISGPDDPKPARSITFEMTLSETQKFYRLKSREMLSQTKVRSIVRPRQIAMYLVRLLTPLSLEQIGLRFGGRDHTTVLYACRRVEKLLASNPQVKADVETLVSRLKRLAGR